MSVSNSRQSSSKASMGTDQAPTTENLGVGTYRDATVAVQRLEKTGIMLTREDQMELKVMRELSHENVNGFVGLCSDPPNICILTKYCSKGSLRDVLENDAIKLDIMFKASLLFDLVAGIEYIHKSKLKSHGRLRSTNCCIDGRWVLKITDYGLNGFRNTPTEDNEKFTALLWTAPEILRDPIPPSNGSQQGDIYSFAIILQEILYRCGPYEATGDMPMVPKDLVGRVRNGESTPFRPPLPDNLEHKIDDRFLELMTDSWHEDPNSRPDVAGIKSRLSVINKGKRYNIMDNMLEMMEKYANNLEELVAEKTKQLTDEKRKTDLLLYRMLPGTIADALKSGKPIHAELYKAATVYFSDICGFTALSSESTPIQIVDFLNDLWTVFDDTIARYNVYKVETIGDAYMVVGGIPNACADHAMQISNMSLDIMSSVLTFKIRHKPEKQLKVRIGLHSGPAAAGIVGLTMPRYCLFGDTVNTASRMESTGHPMRIHVSETTHSELLKAGIYHMSKRGEVMCKGKGNLITYWLEGRDGYTKPLPSLTDSD